MDYGRYLGSSIAIASSLLLGGNANASSMSQSSSLLKSEIASIESVYDKNVNTRLNASNLLYETAVHESDLLKYSRQLGGGPAVSKFQIEPITARNLVQWAHNKPKAINLLTTESGFTYKQLKRMTTTELSRYLVNNEKFATAIARLKYASSPGDIPSTISGRAAYWSKYYQGTNNPVKQGKYISDNRKMAEELRASSISRVVGKHMRPIPNHPSVLGMHKNKIGHAISSVFKKLAMRGL